MQKFNPEYVSYEELYKAYLDCRKRKRRNLKNINLYRFNINSLRSPF